MIRHTDRHLVDREMYGEIEVVLGYTKSGKPSVTILGGTTTHGIMPTKNSAKLRKLSAELWEAAIYLEKSSPKDLTRRP